MPSSLLRPPRGLKEISKEGMKREKRWWVWLLASGAAVASGAYLLYCAWSQVEREEEEGAPPPGYVTPRREARDGSEGSSARTPGGSERDMVKTLLSPEAMLVPLKHRESHYTRLLAENAAHGNIPADEVDQYRKQFSIVQELTHALETQPENTERILHLMQLLQDSGEPPRNPNLDRRLSFTPPP